MMKSGWASTAALVGAAVIISGCTSARLSGPAPLTPAPSGTVTSNQLPPPATAGGFPDAPATATPTETPTQTPDANASANTQVASADPVDRNALVGAWQVSASGASCQMFMALTSWGGGYRAASRGCPGDAANVSVWDVSGSQVVLSDNNGNRVATLSNVGANRFSGTTSGGTAITLSR